MNRPTARLGEWLGSVVVLAALVVLWWVASSAGWVSRVFLPTPQATFDSLIEGLNLGGSGNGELLGFTLATVRRMDSRGTPAAIIAASFVTA